MRALSLNSTARTPISKLLGAIPGAVDEDSLSIDPDLQIVIEAWATLPGALRAGILAMVRAAKTR
jgi:hypothetical protein